MRKILLLATLLSASAAAQPSTPGQFLIRMETVRSGFTFQNMTEDERRILMVHGAYLKSLFDEGKLTFAGQALDPKGLWGVIVIRAADAEAAAAMLNADPGVKAKVFRGEVVPFRTVFERAAAPPGK